LEEAEDLTTDNQHLDKHKVVMQVPTLAVAAAVEMLEALVIKLAGPE
jgi:hypothetical protein